MTKLKSSSLLGEIQSGVLWPSVDATQIGSFLEHVATSRSC